MSLPGDKIEARRDVIACMFGRVKYLPTQQVAGVKLN